MAVLAAGISISLVAGGDNFILARPTIATSQSTNREIENVYYRSLRSGDVYWVSIPGVLILKSRLLAPKLVADIINWHTPVTGYTFM